jgi:RNA polymerase sigma-32 factor
MGRERTMIGMSAKPAEAKPSGDQPWLGTEQTMVGTPTAPRAPLSDANGPWLGQEATLVGTPAVDEDGKEAVDLMASNDDSQEYLAIENQENSRRESMFKNAFASLNEREKDILTKRQMIETPLTLEELSQVYQVSRERIRQIEESAIKKIKKIIHG